MKRAICLCFVFNLFIPVYLLKAASIPPTSVERVNQVPDLCQSDSRAGFPDGGRVFCCIVAVSNSLMWLGEHGYPNLIDQGEDPFESQVALCKKLAGSNYMNTNLKVGTGTPNIMRGVKKYVEERGYTVKRLDYRGWRKHPVEMAVRSLYPSLDWIKEGIQDKGSVWLNIGWYRYNASSDTYQRINGHWVTVVGYGENEASVIDPNVLIFHDPSARTGMSLDNEYVKIKSIESGRLTGEYSGLPRSANGFLKTADGMHVKPPADCGIIDGAVRMVLERPGSSKRLEIKEDEVAGKLNEARYYLAGADKDLPEAQFILRSLMTSSSANISSEQRCYILVYLGYIEDLQGSRKKAKRLFQKAVMIQGAGFEGIRSVAKDGVRNPVTYIRHLDENGTKEKYKLSQSKKKVESRNVQVIDQIGSALIFDDPLVEKSPAKVLSPDEYQKIYEDLVRSIDRYYSFFNHKKIDWNLVTQQYRGRLEKIRTTRDFYGLLYELIRELKDAHSWLKGYEAPSELDSYAPQISIRRIEDKPVVVYVAQNSKAWQQGIRSGCMVTHVNGEPAERYMQILQKHVKVSSSQRHLQEVLTRKILCGPKDSSITVDFLSPEGKVLNDIQLARQRFYLSTKPAPSFPQTSLKYINYGIHPSGHGYIGIKSFKGRMEIADEFDQALEKMRNTKGLIIDIRDNPGGFGTSQRRIIGRFLTEKSDGTIAFKRNGPKHDDFKRIKQFISPSGEWQYKKPVGLLMNPVTGSASDLFAAQLISTGRCISMGRTTHGNLTGDAVYVQLPCDLFVRVSTGYIADASGRIIEGNGNEPEIKIEPTIDDAKQQVDGVLERAFLELEKRGKQ